MTGQTPPSTETLLIVKGTVQGVFFRATTKRLADRLGIRGYVRNLSDGSVEICITSGNVDSLIAALKKEPPPIHIESVSKTSHIRKQEFSSFQIKY